MTKPKTYKGQWKSAKAEAKYRAKEAILWSRAKREYEAIDVETSFGITRAYRWHGSGTPVVFLHGMTDISARWIPYAEALAGCDVYAIDIMGDVGHSKPDIGFASGADYATWLDESLESLGITAPHLVGASLGAYIALSYAMAPDRVSSLVAFEPVGVVKLKLFGLMMWSLRVGLASLAPEGLRHRLAIRLRQPLLADKAALDVLLQAQRGHPIKVPPCPVFTNEQLQSIPAPVHVLAGSDSVAFDVERLVERIRSTTQPGDARLLPEAGHGLSDSHFEECVTTVRSAIATSERTTR